MNAVTAFEHREDALRAQLEKAQDMQAAVSACAMALEQAACELAQDEQDEHARQRQQAVMALARQTPLLLQSARARGELVVQEAQPETSSWAKLARGMQLCGVLALTALAVVDFVRGRAGMALVQALGVLLLAAGSLRVSGAPREQAVARGIPCVDAQALIVQMKRLCQAADVCVGDLALLDHPAGGARLTGTADDAMLDLLVALMEAKASGRDEMAMRSLSLAEEYLRMLGVEVVSYAPERAAMFDRLPTVGTARTVRPALLKDGRVLRRGVAAVAMEGGAHA